MAMVAHSSLRPTVCSSVSPASSCLVPVRPVHSLRRARVISSNERLRELTIANAAPPHGSAKGLVMPQGKKTGPEEDCLSNASAFFDKTKLDLPLGRPEFVVTGGRDKLVLLKDAWAGIKQVTVCGWGSQGPAQAQNIRDSLEAAGMSDSVRVTIGLRKGSRSWGDAQKAGFKPEDGTLCDMNTAIAGGDLVLLLISDSAQANLYPEILSQMKANATLGLSHGFLLGAMELKGDSFRNDINVIAVCPKGMGPSVRRLYVQGKTVNGSGINASIAVEQDATGNATDIALGWSIALGSPFSFATSMKMEYKSDIFGERGILLGGVHGLVEALYRRLIAQGEDPQKAYRRSVETTTGPISRMISKNGIEAVYESFGSEDDKKQFAQAYAAAYAPFKGVHYECYQEVASGNEIRSVVMAGDRNDEFPMPEISHSPMWQQGDAVRDARGASSADDEYIDPFTAGLYCSMMMSQIDTLLENNHSFTEVCNESIIEAVDSLNPYMHAAGVAFMIDNCSTTAKLGARKWASRFDYALMQQVFPALDGVGPVQVTDADVKSAMDNFHANPVHKAQAICAGLRPSVDISIVASEDAPERPELRQKAGAVA